VWEDQRKSPPAGGIAGEPKLEKLAGGTLLARIHSVGHGPCEFNHELPTPPLGGRFDTCDAAYGHLYASDGLAGAVAETIVRDVPLVDPGPRDVALTRLRGRALSFVRVTRDLRLVSLHGSHPSSFGQGPWLTKCERADYPLTREWARALRERSPKAAGFVWRPRHDEDALAYVLWSDRAGDAVEAVGEPLPIDSAEGLWAVRQVLLERHNAVVLR
jgi:hypothetical protein